MDGMQGELDKPERAVDVKQVGELRELLGDELGGLIDEFLSSCDSFSGEYAVLAERADHAGIASLCHGLRGVAANLGCIGLVGVLRDWELAAKDAVVVDAQLVSRAFGRVLAATRSQLG